MMATEEPIIYPARFTADAHLLSVLGEQLISSEKVGILELIKNAYDAGAETCGVAIEKVPGLEALVPPDPEIANLEGPVISITDDGVGMGKERLNKAWLRAATTFRTNIKEKLKLEREQAVAAGRLQELDAIVAQLAASADGRLPLGEKGIGRLATHRLGRYLWLRTKQADDPWEWELRIDWNAFDAPPGEELELSAVPLKLVHQPPTRSYGPKNRGTCIISYGGRPGFGWSVDQIKEVGRAIASLQSPQAVSAFVVAFKHVYDLAETFERPIDESPAPFEVEVDVRADGTAQMRMEFKAPPHLQDRLVDRVWKEEVDLKDGVEDRRYWTVNGALRLPECGPFTMRFRIWNRDAKWLKLRRSEVNTYLDVYGGIGIYRDGIAVMPADMTANVDAFRLAVRGRKKGSRLTYYNLVGEIEITQKLNLAVQDQSSREGQLKNREYQDLIELARTCVIEAEQRYLQVHDELKRQDAPVIPVRTLRRDSAVAANVMGALATSYDFVRDPLALGQHLGAISAPDLERILLDAAKTVDRVASQIRLLDEQMKGLIEAAGFGLAISIAVHEIGKSLSTIQTMAGSVAESGIHPEIAATLLNQATILQSELRRIDPLRVTKLDRATKFNIREAISGAAGAVHARIEEDGIKLVLPKIAECFDVKARFGACSQVLANLLDNAIYWLTRPSRVGQPREIRIVVDLEKRQILVADSGPGVKEAVRKRLFEPYVTGKPELGQGLGLFICANYLEQMGATIRLLPTDSPLSPLSGACFLIDFSAVPKE